MIDKARVGRCGRPLLAAALVLLMASPALGQTQGGTRLTGYQGSAPVALVHDMSSGTDLFARGERTHFVPASLVKLMTAYVVLEQVKAGKLSLDQTVTVPAALVRRWQQWPRASAMRLRGGEVVSIAQLLDGMITASGNDAAELLAAQVDAELPSFLARMNRTAQRLGMANSRFATVTGWPDGGKTRVTARDMARLAERLIRDHPAAYARFFGNRSLDRPGGVRLANRNPLLGRVAGADGLKTGHISTAGYTLVGSAQRGGRRLIVVLGGAQSQAQRAQEAAALLDAGFAAMTAAKGKATP